MRRSSPIKSLLEDILLFTALAYLCGYVAVRATHTKHWFDKTTEETGSYTFFDTWSRSDMLFYRIFYPVIVLDSKLLRRDFVRDKW